MKKTLLIIGMFFFSISISFSQRTILDFEADGNTGYFEPFGADNWTGDPLFSIIANPDASGINQSDSIAQYIEPNEGEPWMGMFYKPANSGDANIDFTTGYTELCVNVWMAAAGTVTLKAENNTNNIVFESAPIDVTTTGAWVEVCYDFAGSAVDGQMIETFVIFFNILSVPTSTTNHYFDNLVQSGIPTSVNNIPSSAFKVFPNPVSEMLNFTTDFEVAELVISDMFGKEISRSFTPTINEISMAGMTPGVYTITFVDNDGKVGAARFVKM